MFHVAEETAADYDRLQRGGIVLIEINISTAIFLVGPTSNESGDCHAGVVVSSSLGGK